MFVYLLESAHCYKIGIAENVEKRIRQLQTGNPHKIYLIYSFLVKDRDEALRLESRFHEILRRFNKSGEWYLLKWQDAKTIKGMFYAIANNDHACWSRIRRRWFKMERDSRYYAGLKPYSKTKLVINQKGKTS
jgi:predicted GIY-YIG superfamily endonuclease